MLTLQVFQPAVGLASPSPFSTKAIYLMEMSGLDYRLEYADPRKAPKAKLPVLIDGDKIIPDSSHIQAHLESTHNIVFDKGLNEQDMAIAQAFRRLNEEHLYWVLVYSRWIDNGDKLRDFFFEAVPAPMRKFVFGMVLKQVKASLHGQGMGRHTPDEIYAFGKSDLRAISNYLGDKQFLFGDEPSSIDASICGTLANIIVPEIDSPLKEAALSYNNLVKYFKRFDALHGAKNNG